MSAPSALELVMKDRDTVALLRGLPLLKRIALLGRDRSRHGGNEDVGELHVCGKAGIDTK